MPRHGTRSEAVKYAFRNRETVNTYGALRGEEMPLGMYYSLAGQLAGLALRQFQDTCDEIRYVIISYSTPIAWWIPATGWTYVARNFSPSTGKHQSAVRVALDGQTIETLQAPSKLSEPQVTLLGHLRDQQLANAGHLYLTGREASSARKLAEYKLIHLAQAEGRQLATITSHGMDYYS